MCSCVRNCYVSCTVNLRRLQIKIKVWIANAVNLIMKKILYICRIAKYEIVCSLRFCFRL